jgi:hypothetical protein
MRFRRTNHAAPLVLLCFLPALGFGSWRTVGLNGGTDPCYAFINQGDVWLACGRPLHRVVKRQRGIADFAVAVDGSFLAFTETHMKSTWVWWGARVAEVAFDLHVVSLQGAGDRPVLSFDNEGGLEASCGTILAIFQPHRRDVLRGGALGFKPYRNFRCSADCGVVVGLTKKGSALKLGLPPDELAPRVDAPLLFDVSPSGRYVAYVQDRRLCVKDLKGGTACTGPHVVDIADRISVSESGEVIFQRDLLGGMAQGLAAWNPSTNSVTTLEAEGWNPQWLSPPVASALDAWAAEGLSPRPAE